MLLKIRCQVVRDENQENGNRFKVKIFFLRSHFFRNDNHQNLEFKVMTQFSCVIQLMQPPLLLSTH